MLFFAKVFIQHLLSDTTDSINTLSSNDDEENDNDHEVLSSDHGSFKPPFFSFYLNSNPLLFFLYSSTEWSLQNWLFDKVTKQLHAKIINLGHWDVHPLAAYTPNDMLIHPLNYKKELVGAMVVMSFCLKYALPWNSNTKKYKKV